MNLTEHHAYALEAGDVDSFIRHIEKEFDIRAEGNPDLFIQEYETFGIDDARSIATLQSRKAVGEAGKQVFILSFQSITTEAQNALLKVFEEPTPHTYFFLRTSYYSLLLPTLQSRLHVLDFKEEEDINTEAGVLFIKADTDERLNIIAPLIKEKDMSGTDLLLRKIETALYTYKNNKETLASLKDILKARRYLRGRSPSIKMLLEHIALTTPHIS